MRTQLTPLHGPTAALNRDNAWRTRNGFSAPAHYGNPSDEALAARLSAVVADISWRSRYRVAGRGAAACVSWLATRDPSCLKTGGALKAFWLNDAGAVRGAGVFARLGDDEFLIVSAAEDGAWIEKAASLFGADVQETTRGEAGIALIGPHAPRILATAGITAAVERMSVVRFVRDRMEIRISRFGEHDGYEIWCDAGDAVGIWDRILTAGRFSGLRPSGLDAMDTLDIEAGVPRPWRDYVPAREPAGTGPTPQSLSAQSLVDPEHRAFNGRRAMNGSQGSSRTLGGVLIYGEEPLPFQPLFNRAQAVGRTLSSTYSPALRRAIALVEIETSHAKEGGEFSIPEPLSLSRSSSRMVTARLASLPFLSDSGQIGE